MKEEFNTNSRVARNQMSARNQKLDDYIARRGARETARMESQFDVMKQSRIDKLNKRNVYDGIRLDNEPSGLLSGNPKSREEIETLAHADTAALRARVQARYPALRNQLIEKHRVRDTERQERRYQILLNKVRERGGRQPCDLGREFGKAREREAG